MIFRKYCTKTRDKYIPHRNSQIVPIRNKKIFLGTRVNEIWILRMIFSVFTCSHRAKVSLINLLIVVLTDVPRVSVIWNVIL